MSKKPNYPQAGKTLSLTAGERFALLQALGARQIFLQDTPGSPGGLTASGYEQLACIKELIRQVSYTDSEIAGQLTLDLVNGKV